MNVWGEDQCMQGLIWNQKEGYHLKDLGVTVVKGNRLGGNGLQ